MILTTPDSLKAEQRDLLARITAACPEMTQPAAAVVGFAEPLTPCAGNADGLSRWIVQVRAADLPHLHAFTRGPERDRDAVNAALTLPYSNGPSQGVNTKTKRMSALDAGPAVELLDAPARAEDRPAVGFHPAAGETQDAFDRSSQIVVADPHCGIPPSTRKACTWPSKNAS